MNSRWRWLGQALEKGMETNKTLYKDVEKYVPKMFTPEEIIEQAERLQVFVRYQQERLIYNMGSLPNKCVRDHG
jgi:hypothetical protein